jgi:hypothetical protein
MSYNGTLTTDSGCIRLTSTGLLILGRKYKLKYTIGDIENTYASIEFSGNANFIWDLYPGGFEKKTAGVHEEILTCINDADNFFEIQAGISDLGVDGKFSISNISLKIIE